MKYVVDNTCWFLIPLLEQDMNLVRGLDDEDERFVEPNLDQVEEGPLDEDDGEEDDEEDFFEDDEDEDEDEELDDEA